MKVRPYKPDDAPALVALFHAAVHEIARLYYSRAQVNAWAPEVPDPATFRARAADGRTVLVAVDDGGRAARLWRPRGRRAYRPSLLPPRRGRDRGHGRALRRARGGGAGAGDRPGLCRGERAGAALLPQAGLRSGRAAGFRDRRRGDPQFRDGEEAGSCRETPPLGRPPGLNRPDARGGGKPADPLSVPGRSSARTTPGPIRDRACTR